MNKKVKVKMFFDRYGFDKEKHKIDKVVLAQNELNEFIENNNIRVIDVKFQIGGDSYGDVALMLVYAEIPIVNECKSKGE